MKLRFSLWTLFVLILVLAVALALVSPYLHRWRTEQQVVAEVTRRGGQVYYHHQVDSEAGEAPGPRWLRRIFGENCLATVHTVWLQHWDVPVWKYPPITDDDLKLLAPLTELRSLMLDGSDVTDAGLIHLQHHPLKELHLTRTGVTDEGIKKLRKIETLERLNVGATAVTDASLEQFREMPRLTWAHVGGTKVRRETVDEYNRSNSRQLIQDGRETFIGRP